MKAETTSESLDDRMDRIVARHAERLARGERADPQDLLAEVPEAVRGELARVLRMLEVGMRSGSAAPLPIGPGSEFDGFRIERELGRGGMAVVYLARQIELDRPVALKVLRPGLALDTRHVERFRREALAVARLSHPHIVQIHAVGSGGGHPYLAMEYVEGPTLAEVYAALPPARERTAQDLARAVGWPVERVAGKTFEVALAELLAPAARALATAHEVGLVHRDVKPSNILIRKDGGAVVADFGLAKGDGDPSLSLSGEPLGTPYYMSPEQAAMAEARVDRRTDVYSFGVVLYEGLSGSRPFGGKNLVEVLDNVRGAEAIPLRVCDPRITPNAASVVRCAMQREREQRYSSALELAVDLNALAQQHTTQAHARDGGEWRRALRSARAVARGELLEYESPARCWNLPLLAMRSSARPEGRRGVARGWLAIGPRAVGVVAIGGRTLGVVSLGGFGAGVVSFGGFSLGLLALGGFSLGGVAQGGFAAGAVATGGFAAGYAAVGGGAAGHYAAGGKAWGRHLICAADVDSPARRDAEAVEFFERNPWIFDLSLMGERMRRVLLQPDG